MILWLPLFPAAIFVRKEALAAVGRAGKIHAPQPRRKKSSVAQW
jgi:hypothetical protein